MNTGNFATGSAHYIHLADPSDESNDKCEKPQLTTLSIADNPLADKLSLIAPRGILTSEEYAQLAVFVVDR